MVNPDRRTPWNPSRPVQRRVLIGPETSSHQSPPELMPVRQVALSDSREQRHGCAVGFTCNSTEPLPIFTEKSSGNHSESRHRQVIGIPHSLLATQTMTRQRSLSTKSMREIDFFDPRLEVIDHYFSCINACSVNDQNCPIKCLSEHMNFSDD